MASAPDTAARKRQLDARLVELDRQIHEIEAELDSHQNRDWSELAQEREADEVLESQGTAGQAEMAAIRAALGRIEDGSYGACVQCGEDIAAERLDLLPQAALCARCARAVPRRRP